MNLPQPESEGGGKLSTDMTTPDDATILELLAACDAPAETTERTLHVIPALAEAHILGKRPSDAVLNGYTDEAKRATAHLPQFRALIAQFRA